MGNKFTASDFIPTARRSVATPQQIPPEEAARLRPGYKSQALGYYLNTDTGKMEVWCEATQTWEEKP